MHDSGQIERLNQNDKQTALDLNKSEIESLDDDDNHLIDGSKSEKIVIGGKSYKLG